MDSKRFEALLRSLSLTRDRRGIVRGLAGSALGGLITGVPLATEAKKGGKGKKRNKKAKGATKGKKGKKVKGGNANGNGNGNGNGGQGGKGQEKITICHKGQTITVARPAWKGHEKHGDTMGPCEATTTTAPPTTTTQAPTTTGAPTTTTAAPG